MRASPSSVGPISIRSTSTSVRVVDKATPRSSAILQLYCIDPVRAKDSGENVVAKLDDSLLPASNVVVVLLKFDTAQSGFVRKEELFQSIVFCGLTRCQSMKWELWDASRDGRKSFFDGRNVWNSHEILCCDRFRLCSSVLFQTVDVGFVTRRIKGWVWSVAERIVGRSSP